MLQPHIFFNEGYDPSSRIRTGRIYERSEGQPQPWHVTPHPALRDVPINTAGTLPKQLITFREFNFFAKLSHIGIVEPCIVLGNSYHHTLWSVVDSEVSISGETIIYLKSRKVIGALPKIKYELIKNSEDKENIEEKIRLLSIDLSSAAPDSVVDRCREAASAILNCYLLTEGITSKRKDLGQLVHSLRESANKGIAANLADVLAKFHSRTKHIEQANRKTRSISEQDAELSVQALGIILVELGWGYWQI